MLTVLFDVDGTLVFYPSVGRRALERAVAEEWGISRAFDGLLFAGATDTGLVERVGPGRPREAVWRRYLGHLRSSLASLTDPVPLPGVTAMLDRLAAAGVRLGLLTGNVREGARLKLSRTGLWTWFDVSISAFAEDGEPRTEIAAAARRRCGAGPVVVVGDAAADAEAARHIGASVVLVNTGPQERAAIEAAGPDLLVEDLSATDDLLAWLLAQR